MKHLPLLVVLLVMLGSCGGPVKLPPQPPAEPAKYMVPLIADGSDWLCAETNINYRTNNCVTVDAFRAFAASVRAEP